MVDALRRAPMRRSGFRRKDRVVILEHATRERAPLVPIRVPAPSPVIFNQAPKHEYIRSEALRIAYRALPCQHCGAEGERAGVCGAHSNWGMGKGGAIKADDNRAASLCFECHRELDQGKNWSDVQKRSIWVHAHAKTVTKLVLIGLWPASVPVPETAALLLEWGGPTA
jgi:hypothetical protein